MVSFVRVAHTVFVLAAGMLARASAQQCCIPDVSTYCTAGTTVHGCAPSISGLGAPSATSASGFTIEVTSVPGQRNGLVFYGFYQLVTPWAPGSFSFKCIANPIARTTSLTSGGNAGACDGRLSLDFNTWMSNNGGALGSPFVQGQVFHAQGWFRDPGAPKQTNLSNALRFVLGGNCFPTPAGMVVIPAGTFQMGSSAPAGPPYFNGQDTQPVHQVTISRCFWMGATEVTQAQYLALIGTNPSAFSGANNPVERVTRTDAMAYCAALNSQQTALGNVPAGYQYRLPTEAEWEYTCRAGTTTEFNLGADLSCNQANFAYSWHSTSSCGASGTVPVASYAPNAWGLYDMHGNVWEWCMDAHSTYPSGSVTDPVASGPYGVLRGGSFGDPSNNIRSAGRNNYVPSNTAAYVGFRVVLAPILVP